MWNMKMYRFNVHVVESMTLDSFFVPFIENYYHLLEGFKTKIILIFASMSGNTEMMAQAIAKCVKEMGEQIEIYI
jgi:flavorubredoxin